MQSESKFMLTLVNITYNVGVVIANWNWNRNIGNASETHDLVFNES